ncbi:MAG TPA: DUF6795 domain-containing protein, partial [Limnobacter sp.]|nr:DUF6795 domain-containing protein [Limnobacter sp.]
MINSKLAWLALLLAVVPLFHGCAMAKETVLLWPAIEGQILNQGRPVPGLELTQTLYWNYEPDGTPPRVAVARTDGHGRFSFPRVTGEVRPHLLFRLFHQPSVANTLGASFGGKEIRIYTSGSGTYTYRNGFNSKDQLICDLSTLEEFEGRLLGKCIVREIKR